MAEGFERFGARSTADEVVEGVDLSGRVVVVTGANTGIGFETARALASAGASVTLACRDRGRAEDALGRIRARHPGGRVEVGLLDLASPESVRSFADGFTHERIDVLVGNAGVVNASYRETEDGVEHTVGVSHLGHFQLVQALLPKLLAGGGARVVMVSSDSHYSPAKLDFDRLPLQESDYKSLLAYSQAKLCNVLFANELWRRYGDRGLCACSLHPGNLVTTEIGRDSMLVRLVMTLVSPFTKSPAQGAATSVLCAVHPDPSAIGGLYFSHCQSKPASAEANDPEVARRLWEWSERRVESAAGAVA